MEDVGGTEGGVGGGTGDGPFGDASRRTYLAEERTLLAWWRTGLACFAVGMAIGRFFPDVHHDARPQYLALGAGYGVLGLAFVGIGTLRQRQSARDLPAGRFTQMSRPLLVAFTSYMVLLAVASGLVLFWER